jgi:uncharacterized protein
VGLVLRSFRVGNHRSIRDEQVLSLLPAYDKQQPVIPVVAIYGANASGKSNLLDALMFMRAAVRTSYSAWEPGGGVPRHPFRLDPSYGDRPSIYVVDLNLDGVRHSYGFAIDDKRVREEWLYAYPHARRRIIFERDGDTIKLGSTLPSQRTRETALAILTRDNTLLLSSAAHANLPEAMPVYTWFRNGIDGLQASSSNLSFENFAKRLNTDSADRKAIIELIRVADLGITDIQVNGSDPSVEALERILAVLEDQLHNLQVNESESYNLSPGRAQELAVLAQRAQVSTKLELAQRRPKSPLLFLQGKYDVSLKYDEQSEGTRTWIALLDRALTSLERGSALVIDEIDTSLHPRLTARLIELFQDRRTNQNAAQLIFATHDASLLGTSFGQEILRRDQIWFVEKDADGATALFALTDFHPRKDENTERRYLGGSYGGVPRVFPDTLVDAYLAARPELAHDTA